MILQIAVLVISSLVSGYLGYNYAQGQSAVAELALKDKIKAIEIERDDVMLKASETKEIIRTKKQVVYRNINHEIEKIVDRPVYRNVCIDDDGLRLLNSYIGIANSETLSELGDALRTDNPPK